MLSFVSLLGMTHPMRDDTSGIISEIISEIISVSEMISDSFDVCKLFFNHEECFSFDLRSGSHKFTHGDLIEILIRGRRENTLLDK